MKNKFISDFENQVKQTIEKYKLFSKKDKILVAASGGKDSTVLLYLLKKFGYDVNALTINAFIGNYSKESLANLKNFCKEYKIKLHEVSLRKEFGYSLCYIRSILKSKGTSLNSCAICGALRRYLLNKYARKLKANVIATGHNLNDEAASILMNLFRNTMEMNARIGPKTESKGFVNRVKPLYFCTENEVEKYSKLMNFNVFYGWCPCSVLSFRRFFIESGLSDSEMRNLVENFVKFLPKLKKAYPRNEEPNKCRICKEPCRGDLCQACMIIQKLK